MDNSKIDRASRSVLLRKKAGLYFTYPLLSACSRVPTAYNLTEKCIITDVFLGIEQTSSGIFSNETAANECS